MINNERGSVIVVALMVLVLLTIIGIAANNVSRTEQMISTNHLIHTMEFYGAESGWPVGAIAAWDAIKEMSQDDIKVPDNVTWPYGQPAALSNKVVYDYQADPMLDVDGNVILYGDDGTYNAGVKVNDVKDYMMEQNINVGVPFMYTIIGNGRLPVRGSNNGVEVEARLAFKPGFYLPQAALFGNELIKKTGGSGSIEGADQSSLGCPSLADISTDGLPSDVDVMDMVLDGDGTVDVRTGQPVYPVPLLRDVILGMNPDIMAEVIDIPTTYEGVIFATPDADGNVDAKQLTGKGILFVDGNLIVSGGIGWEGMVIVNGEIIVNGGGGLTVAGSVAAWGDITLHGSVSIEYDCEKLADLYKQYSGYRLTSWRQL